MTTFVKVTFANNFRASGHPTRPVFWDAFAVVERDGVVVKSGNFMECAGSVEGEIRMVAPNTWEVVNDSTVRKFAPDPECDMFSVEVV